MEERTNIIIDIKLDEDKTVEQLAAINSQMADLRNENKQLRNEVKEGTKTWSEVSEKLAENESKMKSLKATQSALSGQVSQMTQQNRTYGTSLKEQSAKLQDLRNRYQSLDETQRNSRGGQKMLKEIKELDKALKEADAQQGIFGRNVGDYANKMTEALDKAGVSVKGLKGKFDLLNTNPILFFLGLLVGWLVKLRDKMKDSEQVTQSLSRATTSLKPLMEGLGKVVGKLADVFSNVLNWAIEKTIQALGWLGRQIQKLGNLFGKDWGQGLIDVSFKMSEMAHSTEQAAEATETLDTTMTSFKETLSDTRDELEDFLTTYKKVVEEAKKDNLWDVLMKAGGTKTAQEVIKEMQTEMGKVPQALKDVDTAIDDSNLNGPSAFEQFATSFLNNAEEIEKTASGLSSSFGSLSSIYQQMAKDESKSEAQRADAAKKAKTWAGLQIAANSGTALAKGIAGAMEAEPWPAKLAALATIMASVLSAVAQAKALAAQTYETGGVIGGYHGASMGHDNTAISARKGEMVLNANQQRQLFEIANGGATSSLTATLVSALQAMPAPVLDYKEFTDFTNRVASIDETAKLR